MSGLEKRKGPCDSSPGVLERGNKVRSEKYTEVRLSRALEAKE